MADNYTLISGASEEIDGIICRQPTLGDIFKSTGYAKYSTYLFVMCMTVDRFLDTVGLREKYDMLTPDVQRAINILDLLVSEPSWRSLLIQALDFFTDGTASYYAGQRCLFISFSDGGSTQLTGDVFADLRRFICQSACLEVVDEKPSKFYNEAARRLYEKSKKIKKKKAKSKKSNDPNLELWNVIGAVCVKHPSYNLTNIWDLTVYQLYDQFSRLQNDVQFDTIAHRWAVWGKDHFDFSLWFKKNQTN